MTQARKIATFEVSTELFHKLVVGKRYRFDGRIGRVIAKHEPSNVSAVGIVSGRPTVVVKF